MKKQETITFRGQLEFEGSLEDFLKLSAAMDNLPVQIRSLSSFSAAGRTASGSPEDSNPPEEDGDPDPTGVWTIQVSDLLSKGILERVAKGMPGGKISHKISGGIQQPHLHLNDEVFLLDRARFKEFVGEVAREIGERIADREDYTKTVRRVNQMT